MAKYLDMIESPADLKKLHPDQLESLAGEVRERIIDVVSQTGGHLASSLGAVELTLALHYVYNSPEDKIVWDVGHQSYAHKILTGRNRQFDKLRQYGGLSGFPKISESPHDAFGTGHSSTSISAALGLAAGRDLRGEHDKKVIAVIGDGSMTGGMAYEALNNAGHTVKNFLVILNDNKMAISQSVGAMSAYLNRIITSNFYNTIKLDVEMLLGRIPRIGKMLVRIAQKIEESLKGLVVPGIIFEEMGFRYIGPIDGHDIRSLIRILKSVKKAEQPVFLHILTTKGKGYIHSENNPEHFHGTGSFDPETGEVLKKSEHQTYTSVFGEAVINLARSDSRIVAITAAMAHGTGLTRFAEQFPNRFFDVGIAEEHAVTFAAGLALQGHKPIVAVYSTFLQRAYDQIVHDVCLQKLPVIFAIDRAGIVGEDGPTHHGVFDISYLRHIPHLTVMQPKDAGELEKMMKLAVDHNGPVAIRYPRCEVTPADNISAVQRFAVGESEIIREGKDGYIVALGEMVTVALGAQKLLAEKGIDVGVVNARFIKPLDGSMLAKVTRQTKHLFIIEEHALQGGFGSAVLEWLNAEKIPDMQVGRFGVPDRFIEHDSRRELLKRLLLSPEGVAQKITEEFFSADARDSAAGRIVNFHP